MPVLNPRFSHDLIDFERTARYVTKEVSEHSRLVAISTPESRAIFCGKIDERDNVIPSRLNLGYLREVDTAIGAHHLLQVIKNLECTAYILDSSLDHIGIVSILRESEAFGMRANSREIFGKDLPYMMIEAGHIPDSSNSIGRTATLSKPKMEGFGSSIDTLIIIDSIASGLNQGAVIEYLKDNFPEVSNILIIASYASLFGSLPIARYCEENDMRCVIGSFGGFLKSRDLERYYSPLPYETSRLADARDWQLHKRILGEKIARGICVGGNWTGNYLAPEVGRADFEGYLKQNGQTIEKIQKRSPSLDEVISIYGNLAEVTPYSTLWAKEQLRIR
ncbi:MAG: hypothetical protein NDI94_05230 [Candidatus Woesearchaeota archaeon]|nr:hypothetical protein [Candidatus Woesearchaeota archaeon]